MAYIHVHTCFSLLDSTIKLRELVSRVKELGVEALCVTEHGNLYSSVELYKLCQEYGVKYIMGCEMYITPQHPSIKNKENKYNHLVVIAKNETGRLNLIKLVSEGNKYKYYGKPRIDYNMLLEHKDGLIVTAACLGGEVQRAIMDGDIIKATNIALKYKNDFGDDYYLELQSHRDDEQRMVNRKLLEMAKELDIKYIITPDAHYLTAEDQKYHNVFVQIGQAREAGEFYTDCYIQTEEEVYQFCDNMTREEVAFGLAMTEEIADKCNVTIPLSAPIMPHINIPDQFKDEMDYLKYLCVQGFRNKKIDTLPIEKQREYLDRLKYEISTIREMGFEGYYLLVESYANSVRRRGIARGSGGGSLVAYLTNIVDIDPVKYGLYFERFLDVGALELLKNGTITKEQLKIPDVDLDFGKQDRNNIMNNIVEQYGQNRVAALGSFQYILAKGAIKDIGKVLNIPFETTNKMTKNLDGESISEALELGLLDEYKGEYPELFVYAEKLAGLPKSFSVHPCGKIISMEDTITYNAVEISDDGELVLQGDMHTAEDLGLVKIDILGLRTVDVIYDVLDMIGKDYEYIAPHNLDFNDKKVFENFRNGFTDGIFQFESEGMKKTLENIEVSELNDLFVANALYRPGSMKFIENYALRKKGLEEYEFLHPDLEDILGNTYGIIVFQEQLIEIGRLAKLTNPDELRQATAKKKDKLLAKLKPELYDGLQKRGWTVEQLDTLWDIMLDFAKYSFNLSHSAAYAIIAYICMYLKTYHPKEFICAWINSYGGKIDKLPVCKREAQRLGIPLKVGDWRSASSICTVKDEHIEIGTLIIKFCNTSIAEELKLFSNNNYNYFVDLIRDIKMNTTMNNRQLKILTSLNFFSEFGRNNKLLAVLEEYDKRLKNKNLKETTVEKRLVELKEFELSQENKNLDAKSQVQSEKESLGFESSVYPNVPENIYMVTEIDDKYTPKLRMYRLKDGLCITMKCKKNDIKLNPFGEFSVIKVQEITKKNKTKKVDGEWVKTDEKEIHLTSWTVVM